MLLARAISSSDCTTRQILFLEKLALVVMLEPSVGVLPARYRSSQQQQSVHDQTGSILAHLPIVHARSCLICVVLRCRQGPAAAAVIAT